MDKNIISIENTSKKLYPIIMVDGSDDEKKVLKYFKEKDIKFGVGQTFNMGAPFTTDRFDVHHISVAMTEEEMMEMEETFKGMFMNIGWD